MFDPENMNSISFPTRLARPATTRRNVKTLAAVAAIAGAAFTTKSLADNPVVALPEPPIPAEGYGRRDAEEAAGAARTIFESVKSAIAAGEPESPT